MRKLASVRKISELNPIDGADRIEVATVDGWNVVVKKDEFKVNDLVIYLEVDSWVPHELAPFLSGASVPKEYNGVPGARLKTIRLRGQISQGLILPLEVLGVENVDHITEGENLTELLNIQKWEKPVPAQLAGKVQGSFPSYIPKTDQERIQNIFKKMKLEENETFEVSLKLDGSSMTLFKFDDEIGVCSRNNRLVISDENSDNTFVMLAQKYMENIKNVEGDFAVQGEAMGPGIQKNRENFSAHDFFVFDVYDIKNGEYLLPNDREEFCEKYGFTHVPVLEKTAPYPDSVEYALAWAEGKSINAKVREGIVFKSNVVNGKSFKCISNKFLLKYDE